MSGLYKINKKLQKIYNLAINETTNKYLTKSEISLGNKFTTKKPANVTNNMHLMKFKTITQIGNPNESFDFTFTLVD